MERRSREEIRALILEKASNRVQKTRLMSELNLSWYGLCAHLSFLEKRGMIKVTTMLKVTPVKAHQGRKMVEITDHGRKYLQKLKEFLETKWKLKEFLSRQRLWKMIQEVPG